jgi:hypothetical protein
MYKIKKENIVKMQKYVQANMPNGKDNDADTLIKKIKNKYSGKRNIQ